MSGEGTAPEGTAAPEGTEGQGTTQDQGGLFDSYLQNVPEDGREVVTSYLKDAEKQVNSKLAEAAQLREKFGPYSEIDLSRVQPDQLSQVIEWYSDMASDPEKYKEWLAQEAQQAGILPSDEQPSSEGEPEGDSIEAYIQSAVAEALKPVTEKLTQREQQEQEQALGRHVDTTLRKLESDYGSKFTDEQEEAILALGQTVQGDDWVEQGFAKFQALTGAAQADLVKDKAGQPVTPLPTGGTAAPPAPKTFAEAKELARGLFAAQA